MTISTADLLDADPLGLVSCETQLRQFGGRRQFAGRIRTVRCYDDTVLVKQVLAENGDGQVLVIDGGGSTRTALMGDRTAALAHRNGWSGLIIYGQVRDVDALAELNIGIKALGSNPRKPDQFGQGLIDVPATFGGVTFHPGAMVWSDADGVITEIVPAGSGQPAERSGQPERDDPDES